MTLDKTWEDCLDLWKWISERWDGRVPVGVLKREYFMLKKLYDVFGNCFFCAYKIEMQPGLECERCPGVLVDPEFSCVHPDYNYRYEPKRFYQKLLELNAIRLERIKDGKSSSNIQKN